jgi:hypothetical protein
VSVRVRRGMLNVKVSPVGQVSVDSGEIDQSLGRDRLGGKVWASSQYASPNHAN